MEWIKPAVVLRVVDGDTVVLDIDLGFRVWLRGQHVRLVAMGQDGKPIRFDAPELTGPLATLAGRAARDRLGQLLPAEVGVTVQTFKGDSADKYGRWLAVVWLDRERELSDVARVMAADGFGVLHGG